MKCICWKLWIRAPELGNKRFRLRLSRRAVNKLSKLIARALTTTPKIVTCSMTQWVHVSLATSGPGSYDSRIVFVPRALLPLVLSRPGRRGPENNVVADFSYVANWSTMKKKIPIGSRAVRILKYGQLRKTAHELVLAIAISKHYKKKHGGQLQLDFHGRDLKNANTCLTLA